MTMDQHKFFGANRHFANFTVGSELVRYVDVFPSEVRVMTC